MTAILAGLMIGIGDIALLSVDNRYMGALLFSVALLSIIHLKLPLYTGRIGKVILHGNYIECLKILFFNVVGVGLRKNVGRKNKGSAAQDAQTVRLDTEGVWDLPILGRSSFTLRRMREYRIGELVWDYHIG